MRIDASVEELVERLRADHRDRAAFVDEAFVDEIEGDLHRRFGTALAVARLQHEQFPALDRELEILHVAIVPFEAVRDLLKLREDFGLGLRKIRDLLGRADAGDDVFALRVAQILAEQHRFAGVRIAREGHARARVVAEVAEDHLHHGHGRAPIVGNSIESTVVDRAFAVPRVEDGSDRQVELLANVLREIAPRPLAHDFFELAHELFPRLRVDLRIVLYAERHFEFVQALVEAFLVDVEHDVGEHRDEPAVGVPSEPRIVGERGERLDGSVVEAEIQDRVHHPGHRDARAAANRDEQRIFDRSEALAGTLLEFAHRRTDLFVKSVRKMPFGCVERQAGFGAYRKSRRNRQAGGRHLRESRTLSAKQISHRRVALVEEKDELGGAGASRHELLSNRSLRCASRRSPATRS